MDDKFPLPWKLDAASEALKLYIEGSEQECIFLETFIQRLAERFGQEKTH